MAARKFRVCGLPRRRGGGLGLPDRRTDRQTACLPGGRCQLGTRCGLGCAVRGPLRVSEVSRGRASCAAAAPGLPRGTWAGGPARSGITFLCGWMCAFKSRREPSGFPGAAAHPRPGWCRGGPAPAAPSLAGSAAGPAGGSWKNPVWVRNPDVPILD